MWENLYHGLEDKVRESEKVSEQWKKVMQRKKRGGKQEGGEASNAIVKCLYATPRCNPQLVVPWLLREQTAATSIGLNFSIYLTLNNYFVNRRSGTMERWPVAQRPG